VWKIFKKLYLNTKYNILKKIVLKYKTQNILNKVFKYEIQNTLNEIKMYLNTYFKYILYFKYAHFWLRHNAKGCSSNVNKDK